MGKVKSKNLQKDKFIITPGGIRQSEKVYLLRNGFHIKIENKNIFKVNTNTKKLSKKVGEVDFNLDTSYRKSFKPPTDKKFAIPITNRWIIYSSWMNESNKPITYFSTKWIVPPAPKTNHNQLIYLFNGIENRERNIILQPVLQWGKSLAGGTGSWAITNWLAGAPTGGVIHKKLVPVKTGDVIEGQIILKESDGIKFNYLCSFRDYPQCDLLVEGIDELCWAVETLECYSVKSFSDYPDSLVTEMTDIEIRVGEEQAKIQWEIHNDVTDNGQHCVIVNNNSPNGLVRLYYKNDEFA